jgi:adenylylsulfate kinase-like enzyme
MMTITDEENPSNSTSGTMADSQPSQFTAPKAQDKPKVKPVVVGLYGIPGSGKTFLLDRLKQKLGEEHFNFYEGSRMIATLLPGGLGAFQKLEEQEKVKLRQLAIDAIGKECADSGRVAVSVYFQ